MSDPKRRGPEDHDCHAGWYDGCPVCNEWQEKQGVPEPDWDELKGEEERIDRHFEKGAK